MTVKDVFERAMHLSDNGDETSIETLIPDNDEYKFRTLSILNILMGELLPYSDTFVSQDGKRPTVAPLTNIDFSDVIPLDDYCSGTVMPYGLVANLFVDENPSLASFAEQRYEELLGRLMAGIGIGSSSTEIEDVYSSSYVDADGVVHHLNTGSFGFDWIARWGM